MIEYLNGKITYKIWIILFEGIFLIFLLPLIYRLNPNNLHPLFYVCVCSAIFVFGYVSLRFYYSRLQIKEEKN